MYDISHATLLKYGFINYFQSTNDNIISFFDYSTELFLDEILNYTSFLISKKYLILTFYTL